MSEGYAHAVDPGSPRLHTRPSLASEPLMCDGYFMWAARFHRRRSVEAWKRRARLTGTNGSEPRLRACAIIVRRACPLHQPVCPARAHLNESRVHCGRDGHCRRSARHLRLHRCRRR